MPSCVPFSESLTQKVFILNRRIAEKCITKPGTHAFSRKKRLGKKYPFCRKLGSVLGDGGGHHCPVRTDLLGRETSCRASTMGEPGASPKGGNYESGPVQVHSDICRPTEQLYALNPEDRKHLFMFRNCLLLEIYPGKET